MTPKWGKDICSDMGILGVPHDENSIPYYSEYYMFDFLISQNPQGVDKVIPNIPHSKA